MRPYSLTRPLIGSFLIAGLTMVFGLMQVNWSLSRLPLHLFVVAVLGGVSAFILQSRVRHVPVERPRFHRILQYGFSWGIPMMFVMSPSLSFTGGWQDPGRIAVFLGLWSVASLVYGSSVVDVIEAKAGHEE